MSSMDHGLFWINLGLHLPGKFPLHSLRFTTSPSSGFTSGRASIKESTRSAALEDRIKSLKTLPNEMKALFIMFL